MRGVVFAIAALAVVLGGAAGQASQTSVAERNVLAGLATEIEFLEVFVDAAEGRANAVAHPMFDYQSLRSKLGEIKQQIDGYLIATQTQPRQLHSLKQD